MTKSKESYLKEFYDNFPFPSKGTKYPMQKSPPAPIRPNRKKKKSK